MEAHLDVKYNSKTIKNYGIVENVNLKLSENVSSEAMEQIV